MATVDRISVSVTRTAFKSSLLRGAARSVPTTQTGYTDLASRFAAELAAPWQVGVGRGHWSRFWSNYLHARDIKAASPQVMWNGGVPLAVRDAGHFAGPHADETEIRVLIYPAAVVVSLTIVVEDRIQIADVADRMMDLQHATEWTYSGSGSAIRNLRGISESVAQAAGTHFLGTSSEPDRNDSEFSLATVILASGSPAELGIPSNDSTAQIVAGLSQLSGPGGYESSRLLDANRKADWSARIYLSGHGQSIWQETATLDDAPTMGRPPELRCTCLHRSHLDLNAHLDALLTCLAWADEACAADQLPAAVTPYISQVVCRRLSILNEGDMAKTYRSEVAKRRIAPMLDALHRVENYIL